MAYEIVVRFPDEMRQPLQEAAKADERSINWIVRTAVAAWLAAQQAPALADTQSASSAGDALPSPTPSMRREAQAVGAG